MKFSEIFKREYYNRMRSPVNPVNPVRDRADSFLKIFQLLEEKPRKYFQIVETGCMRKDHGEMCFGDDGCSSFLFSEFVRHNPGSFLTSVDINQDNVNYANSVFEKSKADAKAYCSDSVAFLANNLPESLKIDLLYLDSFDIERHNPHPSQLHHLKELCAVMPYLKQSNCPIVVVDDHNAFFTDPPIGKGNYVEEYMKQIGAEQIFSGYQIGWILK